MATGDMKNNIKQLQSELKAIKFTHNVEIEGLLTGSPQTYLVIYHHLFTTYNTKLNNDISSSNNELYGKSDMRFMEAVYKILRDMFDYKPLINREQFFLLGYAERKVIMATEILRRVRSKYKPPKSSTFRIAEVKDEGKVSLQGKVQQEPLERSRKIASKSSPVMEGAIVLPSKSVGRGFKIPKTSIPSERSLSEGPYFGAGVATTSPHRDKKHIADCDAEADIYEVKDHPLQEPIVQRQPVVERGSSEAFAKRKFLDLVSPALVKVNERIGKLEIGLMNLEKKEQPTVTSDLPSSTALAAGLTKQMSDVVFKLETLTSRVVLIENRLTMIEARLDSEGKTRQVPRLAFINSKNISVDSAQLEWPGMGDRNNNTLISPSEDKSGNVNESRSKNGGSEGESDANKEESEGDIRDLKVVVIREDEKDQAVPTSKLAFMKSLVNQNDTENTLVSNISASDMSHLQDAWQMQTKLPKSVRNAVPSLDDMVSPIRPYSGGHIQNESIVSFSYGADDTGTQDSRRSSTPTHFTLDTSTMDRVSRISQMMAETKQLLH